MKNIAFLFIILLPFIVFAQENIDFDKKPLAIGIKDSVKVFEYPKETSYRIAYLRSNNYIPVLGLDNDYYKVNYKSITSFILKNDIKIISPELIKKELNKLKADSILKIEKEKELKLKEKRKCKYITNGIDDFTNKKVVKTEWHTLETNDKDFLIMLRNINNQKSIIITIAKDLGCAVPFKNKRSSVKFKLENDNIVSFYHFGDVDCGDFTIIAKLTDSDEKKLKNSPIKTIRFTGDKYYYDLKDVIWSSFFIDQLDCIK
ncbi:hypothetical protein [Polaribacter atrinae]|uniref:hypothetical protein n=1 Tax=Polaribacter atrinae TaxID=1333662 RepID=UPI0030FC6D26